MTEQVVGDRIFVDVHRVFASASTDVPTRIPFIPRPGRYKHPTYGEINLTAERIIRMIAGVTDKIYQEHIPLDLEHDTKQSGAVGWIRALHLNEDGSADAEIEWTPRGVKAISEDRFRYVSPEWFESWPDPISGKVHRDVVAGGALTTRPFFKDGVLRALVASEDGVALMVAPDNSRTTTEGEGEPVESIQNPTPSSAPIDPATAPAAPVAAPVQAPAPAAPGVPAAPTAPAATQQSSERISLTLGEYNAQLDAARAAAREAARSEVVQSFSSQLAQLSERARNAEEALTTLRKNERQRRFTDRVMGRGEFDGQPRWIGKPEEYIATMDALASQFGEDSDVFQGYCNQMTDAAQKVRVGESFTERGSTARSTSPQDPQSRLDQMARGEMAKDPSLTYSDAYNKIMATPEGARIYGDIPVRS